MELIPYLAILFLASLVGIALALLTRPKGKVESVTELLDPPLFVREALEEELIRAMGINEDTRSLPACRHDDIADSFDYEELWEAAAQIPRESEAQKAQINNWEAQAFKDAGERDYL